MWLSDLQKIGITFLLAGVVFLLLGVVSFFDSRLLSFGNVLFVIGLVVLMGIPRTVQYFTGRRKRRGAICFLVGLFMVFKRWAFVGFFIEIFGILNLFADFSGVIVAFLRQVPGIGHVLNHPAISPYVEKLSTGSILPV